MLKKLINFMIIFLCISLVSCSNNSSKKSNNTEGELSSYYYKKALMIEKGLAKKDSTKLSDEYILLQKIYREYFSKYLLEVLDIKKYDDMLIDNKLDFIQKPEEKQTIEQEFDCMDLEYIYLRNVLYIENLENDELDLLRESINKDITLTSEYKKFIEDTYLKVIKVDRTQIIMYDMDSDNFVPNDAIVFKISTYPNYNTEGNIIDKKNEKEKEEYILNLKESMQNELAKKIENQEIYIIEDMGSNSTIGWNNLN
jgi:hypothetical protein